MGDQPQTGHAALPREKVAAQAMKALLQLAYAVYLALDDAEQLEGDEFKIDAENGRKLCAALEALEALPDDQPGYTMGAAAKARWALRDLVASMGLRHLTRVDHGANTAFMRRLGKKAAGALLDSRAHREFPT